MNISLLTIPIILTLLITVLLYFIIGGRGHFLLKTLIVGLSIWIGYIVWGILDSIQGYPTESLLPNKFLIHFVIIHEENKQTGHPGAIFLWISALTTEKKGILDYESTEPRTHRIPYTRKAHETMEDIIKRLMNGETVIGTKKGQGTGKGNGKGAGRGDGSGDGQEETGKAGKEGRRFGSFSISDRGYDLGPIPKAVYPEKK